MQEFLVDTNILSEAFRNKPDKKVAEFLSRDELSFHISVISLHEMKFGIESLPSGKRKEFLLERFSLYKKEFFDETFFVNEEVSEIASLMRANKRKKGIVLDIADALIAATAKIHDMPLATRNIKDFENLDIELVNPFVD